MCVFLVFSPMFSPYYLLSLETINPIIQTCCNVAVTLESEQTMKMLSTLKLDPQEIEQKILYWAGSDNTKQTLIDVLVDLVLGEYTIDQFKKDVNEYGE